MYSGKIIVDIEITKEKFKKRLGELDKNKSSVPDKLKPRVLKKLANVIDLPVAIIYRKYLDEGSFPSDWRLANVSPIFKKGSK